MCGGSGRIHWKLEEVELLKLQKRGQFSDELVKIDDTQIHRVIVLGTGGIKEIVLEGRFVTLRMIMFIMNG
jgi:hypothetical protein